MLARREADPRAELRAASELLEVAHRGHDRRGGDGAHAEQAGCSLDGLVLLAVRGDALVAPGLDMRLLKCIV